MIPKAITNFLQPLIRIRHEEWQRALLMFAYFFLTITSYYIIKPVRNSLFIEAYGATNLPYVWLATIVVLGLFVSAYVKLVDILEKNVLLMTTIAFFGVNLLGFWALIRLRIPLMAGVFFVWVSIFSITMVTQFWMFANDLFNPRQAKRLYGFVGSGGILGGIVGGAITNQTVRFVGTENLLLVAASILLLCIVIVNLLWKNGKSQVPQEKQIEPKEDIKPRHGLRLLRRIMQTRYLLLLLCLVCFAKGVSTIVDFQFNSVVEVFYPIKDLRTAFFGKFFAFLNAFSFCVQFFLTSRILRHFGVTAALLLLPFGLMFGSIAILAHPALWTAVYTMMYDGGLNYSLNTSTKEVLYLPIGREIRYRVKPFIDMFAYRFSKAAASIIILVFTRLIHLSISMLSIIPIIVVGAWIAVIVLMKKEYIRLLRGFLRREKRGEDVEDMPCSNVHLMGAILRVLSPGDDKRLAFSLRLVNLCSAENFRTKLRELDFSRPDLRNSIVGLIEAWPPRSFNDEIEVLLRRENLVELADVVDFITICGSSSSNASYKKFLRSPLAVVRLSAACFCFIQDPSYMGESFVKIVESSEDVFKERNTSGLAFLSARKNVGRGKVELIDGIKQYVLEQKPLQGEAMVVELRSDISHTIEILGTLLRHDDLSLEAKKRILMLFTFLPHAKAVEFLVNLLSEKRHALRRDILLVLRDIRVASPTISFDTKKIIKEIRFEIKEYEDTLNILNLFNSLRGEEQLLGEHDSFGKAQAEHLRESLEKVLLLLGLLSMPSDMHAVYQGLRSENDYVRAQALELLDNVLEPNLRQAIYSLLESEAGFGSGREISHSSFWSQNNHRKPFEVIRSLLKKDGRWCVLSALYLVLHTRLDSLVADVYFAKRSQDPFIQKCGELVERRLGTIENSISETV